MVLRDDAKDVGARNSRRIAALYAGPLASFEVVHGLLDRVMEVMRVPFVDAASLNAAGRTGKASGYSLVASNADRAFFPGRQASVMVGGVKVGTLGVVHPEVLGKFEPAIVHPCSALEIDLEWAMERVL